MTLLHIDASILGANSASRQLSQAVVDRLRKAGQEAAVVYRDLAAAPLAHLSGEHLAAGQGATPESAALQKDIAASQAVLDEFLAADTVVIGAPMYNFTIPSQLKAWIDRIVVAGKTFRYGATGVEGLAGNKRVIIAISRGGFYGAGTPTAGSGLLLNSIAAVVMGGTALSGGVGGPHRTLLGVLVIAILTNGMDVTEVNSFTQDIVKGAVIILAVSLTIDRSKYPFIK